MVEIFTHCNKIMNEWPTLLHPRPEFQTTVEQQNKGGNLQRNSAMKHLT